MSDAAERLRTLLPVDHYSTPTMTVATADLRAVLRELEGKRAAPVTATPIVARVPSADELIAAIEDFHADLEQRIAILRGEAEAHAREAEYLHRLLDEWQQSHTKGDSNVR